MKHRCVISNAMYAVMLDGLNGLYRSDIVGDQSDMKFIAEDYWLGDTAVIERLVLRKGAWEINLLFAHHKNPVKFIVRCITTQSCPRKAAQTAFYMRRAAAKDQRGTLTVAIQDFNLLDT
jgi:hypothetical protein